MKLVSSNESITSFFKAIRVTGHFLTLAYLLLGYFKGWVGHFCFLKPGNSEQEEDG